MTAAYRYLVFARGSGWEVEVDGAVTPGRGESADEVLEHHYADHVLAPRRMAAGASQRRWDDELRRVTAQVGRRTVDRPLSSKGGRTSHAMTVLSFPGGLVEECLPDQAEDRISQRVQTLVGPRPEVRLGTFAEWRESARASARPATGWTCTTFEPDGSSRPIEIDGDDASLGAPLAAITTLLNGFAEAGWTVVATSEDRAGPEGEQGDAPTRIRFLLAKDAT